MRRHSNESTILPPLEDLGQATEVDSRFGSRKLGKTFTQREDMCKGWQSEEEAGMKGMLSESCGWKSGSKEAGSCLIPKAVPSPRNTARAEIEELPSQLCMDTRMLSKDGEIVIWEGTMPSHEALTPTIPLLDDALVPSLCSLSDPSGPGEATYFP